jgi:hypothetical protein
MAVSSIRSNQETSLLGGRIQAFVPRNFAVNFSELIITVVDEIHDAFIQFYYNVGANSSAGSGALLKRIELVQDSFTSARKRIRKGIGDLNLVK